MSANTFEIKPISFALKGTESATDDSSIANSLTQQFASLSATINDATRAQGENTANVAGLLDVTEDFLTLMQTLDQQYGANATLPLTDAGEAVDDALRATAELETWLSRLNLAGARAQLFNIQLGIAYWAMQHELAFETVAPVVNALAEQANAAETRQETAAVFAMMQGFIQHLAPGLQADLERSNPERPWRLLNLNFAITAIRTGDAAMMRYAFDRLNAHLPDECAGFYEEAHALACQPGFPTETRALIEAEYTRWTRPH
ncbi:MAG: hypothetical protein JNN20_03200 [Betaproteobacteria bacterium]|nr:hypothetical protein [Betaproteobacteria bacterium]